MLSRQFFLGFFGCLLLFLIVNLIVVQARSDCGLLGALQLAGCADDISRAGFPFQFWERGGFDYREVFQMSLLILDLLIALVVSLLAGLTAKRFLH